MALAPRRSVHPLWLASSSVALLAAASTSPAQERTPDGELASVVITAERRAADAQSVPVSVAVVSDEEIRGLALRDSMDLTVAVPGLQFDQQGLGATPFIRGVGSMSGAVGNEAPVSMYVDGVYYAMPNASVFGLDDVRQIEVLKGPQGTLFGRNATGGVIQVTTRDPQPASALEVRLGYASRRTVNGSLYAGGSLSDSLAANLSLAARNQADGWGRNLSTGAHTFRHRETGARAKLRWTPREDTRVDFAAGHYRRRAEDGLGYHHVQGALGVDGSTGYPGFYGSWADPQDSARYEHSVASARLEHEFDVFRIVDILSWQEVDGFFHLDQDATPAPVVDAPISQHSRTFTQELQVLSPEDRSLVWIAGLYYLNDVSAYDPISIGGLAAAPFASLDIYSRQRSASYAAFGQTTAHFTPRTHLTIGARYTRDERRIAGDTHGVAPAASTQLAAARQKTSWDKPTWRVALARDLYPDAMAYVSWDRGFKSGVYNLISYAQAPVNPEVLDAYQAGFKSDWLDHRLRLNAAAYLYRYRNMQVEVVATGATIGVNAAAARMRGIDLDLELAPLSLLTLRAAVSLLHGRYSDFRNAPVTVPLRGAGGELLGGNTVVSGDVTGFETARSPARTATLSGRYRRTVGHGDVTVNVGYYYNSGFAWDADNRVRQDAYGVLNASVEWTSPRRACRHTRSRQQSRCHRGVHLRHGRGPGRLLRPARAANSQHRSVRALVTP